MLNNRWRHITYRRRMARDVWYAGVGRLYSLYVSWQCDEHTIRAKQPTASFHIITVCRRRGRFYPQFHILLYSPAAVIAFSGPVASCGHIHSPALIIYLLHRVNQPSFKTRKIWKLCYSANSRVTYVSLWRYISVSVNSRSPIEELV